MVSCSDLIFFHVFHTFPPSIVSTGTCSIPALRSMTSRKEESSVSVNTSLLSICELSRVECMSTCKTMNAEAYSINDNEITKAKNEISDVS